jgi:hypothetical protein
VLGAVEGERDLTEEEREATRQAFAQAASGGDKTPLDQWVRLYAELLSRSGLASIFAETAGAGGGWAGATEAIEVPELATEEEARDLLERGSAVAVPLLLVWLCARTGTFAPLPVYSIARVLARRNVEALARFEGFGAVGQPDARVAQEEGALVAKQLEASLESYSMVLGGLLLLVSLLFLYVAWQLGGWVFGGLGAALFGGGGYDPLDF